MKEVENINDRYVYTFKYSATTSYVCLASKIYKRKYILGCNNLIVPIPFWFNITSNLELPLQYGYIEGKYYDLRQQYLVKLAIDFDNLNNLQVINQ